jgi:hypothetical protein
MMGALLLRLLAADDERRDRQTSRRCSRERESGSRERESGSRERESGSRERERVDEREGVDRELTPEPPRIAFFQLE